MARDPAPPPIQTITAGWIAIGQYDDPEAWELWATWRAEQGIGHLRPRAFTVPSRLPPTTKAAAQAYLAALKAIRDQTFLDLAPGPQDHQLPDTIAPLTPTAI